jgi:SAM-dependent methyltransferase
VTDYASADPLGKSDVDTSRAISALHVSSYRFARDRHVRPTDTVADIACGSGFALGILRGHCAQYIGVDLPDNIARIYSQGRYVGSEARYYGVDLNRDTLQLNQPVDVVISFETIEHLNDPVVFLSQLYNVLREDGLLLLSTPINPDERAVVFKSDHVQEFSRRQIMSMLKQAGFKTQASYSMGVGFGSVIRFLHRRKVQVYRSSFQYRRTPLSRWADQVPGLIWLYCRILPYSYWGDTGTNMLLVARKASVGRVA